MSSTRSRRLGAWCAAISLCSLLAPLSLHAQSTPPTPVAEPSPAATHRAYLPLINAAPAPSSAELIDAAVERGALDPTTGLIYELYADFRDPRLPAQYRGDDSNALHGHALDELAQQFTTLTPEQQALVQPFTLPPFHMESWWQQRFAPDARPAASDAQRNSPFWDSSVLFGEWSHLDVEGVPVRIWWETDTGDQALAESMAAELNSVIWSKLLGLMKNPPNLDDGSNQRGRGGSDHIDIAITDTTTSKVKQYGLGCTSGTPAYMLFNRNKRPWQEELAHEMMHLFQYRYPTKVGCAAVEYAWLMESSAQWAMDFVYPESNQEQIAAKFLVHNPELPVYDTEVNRNRAYGAYLVWLYVARIMQRPDLIATVWHNVERYGPQEVVDKVIPGGWKALWPKVILHNWNQDPVNEFFKQDKLFYLWSPMAYGGSKQAITSALTPGIGIDDQIQSLGARYYYFSVTDPSVWALTFYNGYTYRLGKTTITDSNHIASYDAITWEDATTAEREWTSVQALLKINGKWSYEDWTNQPYRLFCRDNPAEQITDLVLIVGNAQWASGSAPQQFPADPAAFGVSPVGCWQWSGSTTATLDESDRKGTISGNNLVFSPDPIEPQTVLGTQRKYLGPVRYRPTSGNLSADYTISFSCQSGSDGTATVKGSAGFGSKTWPSRENYFDVYPFTTDGSAYLGFFGLGLSDALVPATRTCDGNTSVPLGMWMFTGPTAQEFKNGRYNGSFPSDGITMTWNFKPGL